MKKLKVSYAKFPNMGDLLNELIIENVFGYKVILSNKLTCQTSGIGSSLGKFFPEKNSNFNQKLEKLVGKTQSPVQIWSTGFISYSNKEHTFIRRENNIASVRGELSKNRLEKILNKKLDIPTGDGGLLASYLIKEPLEKKYLIGIIPHYKEKNDLIFRDLQKYYKNSVLVDLEDDPLEVVKLISKCEVILSSSLHGLIVADSLGIPNQRLIYSNKLMGDGFKFDDYYSGFKVKPQYIDLNNKLFPTIDSIIENYLISKEQVEQKQKQLQESFTKYL